MIEALPASPVPVPPVAALRQSASRPGVLAERRIGAPTILAEIVGPDRFEAMDRLVGDLVARAAEDNVFMEPMLVGAAARAAGNGPVEVVLAWEMRDGALTGRLHGAWALLRCRPSSRLPLDVLKASVHDHAPFGIPLLDAQNAVPALAAILDALARRPGHPHLVEVVAVGTEGPVAAAFRTVLERSGRAHLTLNPRQRPLLAGETTRARLSPNRVRALRQRRRRLAERGTVTVDVHRSPGEVESALEEFLALEAAGWKGGSGREARAIRTRPALEAFFRLAVLRLAERARACVVALRVDGRPVALRIVLRSGKSAFTWKSAYDETLSHCAPGLVLLQETTDVLLAELAVALVDSCNAGEEGYMAEFWTGRRAVADLIFDARPGRSPSFAVLAAAERLRWQARMAARRLRAAGAEGRSWMTRRSKTAKPAAADRP
ncbi:GNAT family N-acetyltransferase [Aurantimonas sp. Leaf443]|uniref:GNAT family N-acetyltransferase n=1 Tax=Aurantimonas sp. Leaf443 TaxID=1736378 RepID=UPI0006F7A54D|nr:GNAT family N-acetyltransferase [Aurantimonas sp. Leaf443]KQT88376.1 hypothetical protein ASG48_02845 [Aurantimonas sp. Leaf443]